MAYESTQVPVERSQAQIRQLLLKHGAGGFAFAEDAAGDDRAALIQFQHGTHRVRMRARYREVDQRAVRSKLMRARTRTREDIIGELLEQEAKRIWRVLAWNLKARMVAVEEGVETFEEAFLPHLLDEQTGETIYESLARTGRVELSAGPLALPVGADADVEDAEVVA